MAVGAWVAVCAAPVPGGAVDEGAAVVDGGWVTDGCVDVLDGGAVVVEVVLLVEVVVEVVVDVVLLVVLLVVVDVVVLVDVLVLDGRVEVTGGGTYSVAGCLPCTLPGCGNWATG